MVSLTSWTGQEGAEGAGRLGAALMHSKSKKKMQQQGGLEEAPPSGRMHI